MADDETVEVEWLSASPTVDVDGDQVERGDVATLAKRRADAHRRAGRCKPVGSESEGGTLPEDYQALKSLAAEVADREGDDLETWDAGSLRDYLREQGYESDGSTGDGG
jgi:hypothetical protein